MSVDSKCLYALLFMAACHYVSRGENMISDNINGKNMGLDNKWSFTLLHLGVAVRLKSVII